MPEAHRIEGLTDDERELLREVIDLHLEANAQSVECISGDRNIQTLTDLLDVTSDVAEDIETLRKIRERV